MALIRICDRCAAPAAMIDLAGTRRTLIVPQADPATNAVTTDKEITVGIEIAEDLCAPCLASALTEFALARLTPGMLTIDAIKALVARLAAMLNPPPAPKPIAAPSVPA